MESLDIYIYLHLHQRCKLRWFGHVERMRKDSWVNKCSRRGSGQQQNTWDEVI